MQISITIPSKEEILAKGIPISVASENESWFSGQLGEYAKHSGVYIHHANGNILYVGQTSKNRKWGIFKVRLRRECQMKAAGNSYLYQLLLKQGNNSRISMYNFEEVSAMFDGQIKDKLSKERQTLILEQFMIAVYNPVGNRK